MLLSNLGSRTDAQDEDSQIIDIRVFASAAAGADYPIELSVVRWRDFPSGVLRLDAATLTELRTLESDPSAYGRVLGAALFADGAVGGPYRETVAAFQARGEELRVRLRLDPLELHAIHWERVYHPVAGAWHPLAVTAATPFSRYIPAQQWDRPLPVTERPLRILAVLASPANLADYSLDAISSAERQALHAALDGLAPEVVATYLETGTANPATLNQIRLKLSDGYQMVHFLCHGTVVPGSSVLYLEREDGTVEAVQADRLVDAFKALAHPPLLCLLAACESATRGRTDGFVPLGPALVEDGGVQAVIAMSDQIGVVTARCFTAQFYTRLLHHGLVDLAVNEARAQIRDQWDWGVPVLFSRLPDNQLIDFPVGRFYADYLAHTDGAFAAAGAALIVARWQEHGQQLVHDLGQLIRELSKSHQVMVGFASAFRRTGQDPATFAQRFETFYYDFKAHYDGQTWVEEETSCRKILELKAQILPHLQPPVLDNATFTQLAAELDMLADSDGHLLQLFRTYLDAMNTVVEEIWAQLGSDVQGALGRKRDFEAQITPSFQRSKAMLDAMSASTTHIAAA